MNPTLFSVVKQYQLTQPFSLCLEVISMNPSWVCCLLLEKKVNKGTKILTILIHCLPGGVAGVPSETRN